MWGKLLLTVQDFHEHATSDSYLFTAVTLFFTLFSFEYVLLGCLTLLSYSDKDFESLTIRKKLSRGLSEFFCMMLMSWMGYVSFKELGGLASFNKGVGVANLFVFSGAAQRLILFQSVYEIKNFIKSYIDNDGIVYLVHHVVTFFCAYFALDPFLHYYSSFFIGMSEFSTGILCFYLCFDEKAGAPQLAARFPVVHTITGVLFAINFVIFRVLLWAFFSYHFWIDMIGLYSSNSIHSYPAYVVYAIGNIGLTLLQIKWLGDILIGVQAMLTGTAASSKREAGDVNHSKKKN